MPRPTSDASRNQTSGVRGGGVVKRASASNPITSSEASR